MTEEERKKLIKEKEAELKAISEQLTELKDPTSIKNLLRTTHIYRYNRYEEKLEYQTNWGFAECWNLVRNLSIELFKGKHEKRNYERLLVRDLTHEETRIAADFSDEILEIWNKYMEKIYKEEKYV